MGFLCCCDLRKKDSEGEELLLEAKFSSLPNSSKYTSDQIPETSSKRDNVSSLIEGVPVSKTSTASNGLPAERVFNASRSEQKKELEAKFSSLPNSSKDTSDQVPETSSKRDNVSSLILGVPVSKTSTASNGLPAERVFNDSRSEQNLPKDVRDYSKSEVILSTTDEKSREQSSVIKSLFQFKKDKRTMTSQWMPGSKFGSLAFHQAQRTVTGSTFSSYAPYPMTLVRPHLYLGNIDDANNEPELKAKGITHILSLGPSKSSADFVKNEHFPMHDGGRTDLKEVLGNVQTFVEKGQEDGNNILVHCHLGQNRSATVVIALLMKREDKTLFRVHKDLKAQRPLVQINRGYAEKLLTLEKEIRGKNSLPQSWMEQGTFDLTTYEVTFKYENISSDVHRTLDEKGDL